MPHTIKGNKQLLTRVRRIKGQTEGLERALEEGVDCSSILQQIAAVRGAVNGLMMQVLEGHLRDHLGSQAVDPLSRTRDLEQVVSVIRSYLK